ncbi:hypothetical protein [Pseudoduganella sp. R-43]|uniref:hypothetical protein n=1 Tax=unclassified Pseudoduganella TaxID=2637179 RepID=UPI003CF44F87
MIRTDRILFDSLEPVPEGFLACSELVEADVSGFSVPYGLVHMRKAAWPEHVEPDPFWSWSMSQDRNLDHGAGRIRAVGPSVLQRILGTIATGLARAKKSMDLPEPANVTEGFVLEDGCEYCFGQVLLVRGREHAYYFHYHCES